MVEVTELAAVQTAGCLDAALVSAEQAASRLAVALVPARCPLAVTTARRPVFSPSKDCRREVEGIMWETRKLVQASVSTGSFNESPARPRSSKGRRFLEAGEPEVM